MFRHSQCREKSRHAGLSEALKEAGGKGHDGEVVSCRVNDVVEGAGGGEDGGDVGFESLAIT